MIADQEALNVKGSTSPLRGIVSDTGPMLSFFQSEQIETLLFLYDRVYIPQSTLAEFAKHGGAAALIQELIDSRIVEV